MSKADITKDERTYGDGVASMAAEILRLRAEVARLTQARDKQLEANQEAYFNCINCDGGLTKETWKWLGPHVGPFCDRCVTAARGAAEGALGPWQPIETAPKDGTRIDIWAKAWLPAFDRFESQRFPNCWWWKGDSMGGASAKWMELSSDWHPTHWMPLPAGPLPSPQED